MRKILIIDDEADLCELVKASLEAGGLYEVFTANNGSDGIRIAETEKPDIILLDIIMPRIGGFAVLKELKGRDRTKAIPVIMLSALGDEPNKARALGMSADSYLVKPMETASLSAKIEEILSKRSGGDKA